MIYFTILLSVFTFFIPILIVFIALPLLWIAAMLKRFRIFTMKRMLIYYGLSLLILWPALHIPLSIYSHHEKTYIFGSDLSIFI
ncbi:hypothetical protein COL93_11900 [Bacillus toyonensis]|uniref:Uncharacterized protein n=1 Tax=Bacillus toyonensis TaxID=155322 RepID=A0A2C4QNR9_9BACI|nr:hypothetical protein COL93_11900 [Bacillus toyonensis]PHD66103.1 hypothetical protein COF40_21510 [Bacillus toyonensis]